MPVEFGECAIEDFADKCTNVAQTAGLSLSMTSGSGMGRVSRLRSTNEYGASATFVLPSSDSFNWVKKLNIFEHSLPITLSPISSSDEPSLDRSQLLANETKAPFLPVADYW